MDAGVGSTAGVYRDRLAGHLGKGALQFCLDRGGVLKTLPAAVGAAVVFHPHGQAAKQGAAIIKKSKQGHAIIKADRV